jgi:F-box protein 9
MEDSKWRLEQEERENVGQEKKNEVEDTEELEVFRRQWQEELRHASSGNSQQRQQEKKETEAAGLYWMGVAAERSGDTHSALIYYRHAVQLVPDIEYRVHSQDTPRHLREEGNDSSDEDEEEGEVRSEVVEEGVVSITESLRHMNLRSPVCQPDRLTRATHISSLPCEVLRLVLHCVVSVHLDMRSLEQCSMVCRGFYCLTRQPGLWRMACKKLWPNCSLTGSFDNCFKSWRKMYINRPHLYFHGVYISKISYVRRGEHSLDGYYKPYHTVIYYRYLRFFPDGVVMYQTSPDNPGNVVARLCHKHSSESVLLGEYSLDGDMLTVDVLGYQSRLVPHRHRGREKREITHEQRFHMELIVKRSKKSRIFNQLIWQEHYCHSLHRPTGSMQISHFSIDYKYPPFFFSRVKSYTSNSQGFLS